MDKTIYFDNSATTRVAPEVVEAMMPYFNEKYGNASSIHRLGRDARGAIDRSREAIASYLGARPDEVFFTSCGTESDNLAIKGAAYFKKQSGNHIITSKIEHHAVLNTCKALEKEGFSVTYLDVDKDGYIDPASVKAAIQDKTILMTIMHANNEVGTVEPISEIAKIAKERGIVFHTDAVQSFGKIDTDVNRLGVDLFSISGHKIHAPKGIGALYIRKGVKIAPLFYGGHHERGIRPGTENVPYIVGLGTAVELIKSDFEKNAAYLELLRRELSDGIKKSIPYIQVAGHPEKRLPNILNVYFNYIEGESIILNLDLKGVAVATGSACTSGSLEPSHVLTAMGITADISQGAIRFSLSRYNTRDDIKYVLAILPGIIEKLRAMSPLYEERKK